MRLSAVMVSSWRAGKLSSDRAGASASRQVGLNRGFLGFLCSDDRVGESDRFFDTNGGEAPPKGAGARSTSSSLDISWLIYFQGAYGGCQRKKSSELDVLFGLFLLSLARSSECVGLFAGCSERTTARRYVPWDTGGSCCYLMAHMSRAYTLIPAQTCLPRATFTAPCWLAAAL